MVVMSTEAVAHAISLLLAFLGHAALWTGLVNRIHSTGMPRWLVKTLSLLCMAAVPALPVALLALALFRSGESSPLGAASLLESTWRLGVYYFVPCIVLFAAVALIWVRRQISVRPPAALRSTHRERIDVCSALGHVPLNGRLASFCRCLPGNQIFSLSIEHREIEFLRLPASLDGLSIVHLSDFHFTGRINKEYFQEVVRRANDLEPDIVAVTGDLVDHAPYIDWLPETLGRLRAAGGVYCVFGNHDLRTGDLPRLRRTLAEAGLVYLGGRWQTVALHGETLLLAGNELPWIAPAADMRTCVAAAVGIERDRPFRILLAHSPDQFAWAQRWDFDLMLAGHTHGGQFCLPFLGPVLSPSWHGVLYAGGTFAAGPTVMHVSRGTCSELPFRLNCPPELSKITLRSVSVPIVAREIAAVSRGVV